MEQLIGKKVVKAEYDTTRGYGGDETVTLQFDDGTKLVVSSAWCNDGGSALDVEFEEGAPTS